MRTSLPAHAAVGSLTAAAAADETIGAIWPERGAVPGGSPIGGVQQVLGVEEATAGCPVLDFVVPAWTDGCWKNYTHLTTNKP